MLRSLLRARAFLPALGAVFTLGAMSAGALGAGLPDNRAAELVSSSDKLGNEVVAMSSRTHAAAGESAGLPAAVAFSSLGGFADVRGTGIATEYLSERDGSPGTSGWSVHAITPAQDPTSLLGLLAGLEPRYQAEMSADLTKGVFWASTPLTDAPNVAQVPNLYRRDDLRTPGTGSYSLLTDSSSPLPAPVFGADVREFVAGTSDDFQHVLFESRQNLTPDARGTNVKLYKTDGSTPRLVSAEAACPGAQGARASAPCAAAGGGLLALHYAQRTLSSDGSRVLFTSPVTSVGVPLNTSGAASKLFQLDDRGTASTGDDAIVQIDASEAASPGSTQAATFETASADGSRVFFLSAEQLTNAPSGGLYMWERQAIDEAQSVAVDATGGTFTLTAHAQPSAGSGTLANGSTDVENVSGSFSVGQTITGSGIPSGTTIVATPSSTRLTLSAPATADGDTTLSASVDATTAPLAANATAAQVQGALEGLSTIGAGNVSVSGGPGSAGAGSPYVVTFTGALAGVDVAPLSADGSALSGGGASATVSVTTPVRNLTLIAPTSSDPNFAGTIGASADGHRLYFASAGDQLVSGGPTVQQAAIYSWQDADGTPGGTLSFVGEIATGDMPTNIHGSQWNGAPDTARVTPDGRSMAFEVSDGSGLAPRYDQTHCQPAPGVQVNPNITGIGCSEVYVYRADTSSPTAPDLVCASCNPSGAPGTASAWLDITSGASATSFTTHLSHALSDDGRYVFFSTADALVPEDTNAKFDAYEYDTTTGSVHLLSSGTDTSDSYFLDASADGHDVYFVTRQPLVGWDTDNAYDLYDARVGGGFPEPPTSSACGGDACQGPAAGLPAPPVLGSVVFHGSGDARAVLHRRRPPLRCKRGYVKRRVRGRVRCVRKPKPKRKAEKARSHMTRKRGTR